MTEAEWLSGNDPAKVLVILEKHAPRLDRVVRLFACACCRMLWRKFKSTKVRTSIEAAERFALGEPADLDAAETVIYRGSARPYGLMQLLLTTVFDPTLGRGAVCGYGRQAHKHIQHELREQEFGRLPPIGGYQPADPLYAADKAAMARIDAELAGYLRCLAGNPLAPVTANPAWLTSDVVGLASAVAASWDFGALPILGDALQDAGCIEADVLEHCRDPGPHVRGCWVVDLVLGKE